MIKSIVTYSHDSKYNNVSVTAKHMYTVETEYSPKTTVKGWNEMMAQLEAVTERHNGIKSTIIILNIWELAE